MIKSYNIDGPIHNAICYCVESAEDIIYEPSAEHGFNSMTNVHLEW